MTPDHNVVCEYLAVRWRRSPVMEDVLERREIQRTYVKIISALVHVVLVVSWQCRKVLADVSVEQISGIWDLWRWSRSRRLSCWPLKIYLQRALARKLMTNEFKTASVFGGVDQPHWMLFIYTTQASWLLAWDYWLTFVKLLRNKRGQGGPKKRSGQIWERARTD